MAVTDSLRRHPLPPDALAAMADHNEEHIGEEQRTVARLIGDPDSQVASAHWDEWIGAFLADATVQTRTREQLAGAPVTKKKHA